MPGIPHLAQELLGEIVGHLHTEEWDVSWADAAANKRDLHSCSLVSRAWHAATRRHMFRDIAYSFREDDCSPYEDPPAEAGIWRKFVLARQHVRCKTLRMLCAFLRENPRIQYYIRSLKLELWPSREPQDKLRWRFGRGDEVDAHLFGELLALLPRLTVLHLHNVFVSQRRAHLSSPLIQLNRLHIASCSAQNLHQSRSRWIEPDLILNDTLFFFGIVHELHLSTWGLITPDDDDLSDSGAEEDDTEGDEEDIDDSSEEESAHTASDSGKDDENGRAGASGRFNEAPNMQTDKASVDDCTKNGLAMPATTTGLSVHHLVLDGVWREPRQLLTLLGSSVTHLRRLTLLVNDCGSNRIPKVSQQFLDRIASHLIQLDVFIGRGIEFDIGLEEVDFPSMPSLRELRIGVIMSQSMFHQHERAISNLQILSSKLLGNIAGLEEIVFELSLDNWLEVRDDTLSDLSMEIDGYVPTDHRHNFRGVFVEIIPISLTGEPAELVENATMKDFETLLTARMYIPELMEQRFSFRPVSPHNWLEQYTYKSHPTWLSPPW